MLRIVILIGALLLAVVALWLLARQVWMPGYQLLALAVLAFLGTAFERWRYRKGQGPPDARWQRTDEKFSDPISGEEMQVEYDPGSGERRYVKR